MSYWGCGYQQQLQLAWYSACKTKDKQKTDRNTAPLLGSVCWGWCSGCGVRLLGAGSSPAAGRGRVPPHQRSPGSRRMEKTHYSGHSTLTLTRLHPSQHKHLKPHCTFTTLVLPFFPVTMEEKGVHEEDLRHGCCCHHCLLLISLLWQLSKHGRGGNWRGRRLLCLLLLSKPQLYIHLLQLPLIQ